MNRALVALAMDTGMPVTYWRDECDPEDLDTALELRAQQAREMADASRRR